MPFFFLTINLTNPRSMQKNMYCHRHGYIWLTVFLLWNILPAQGQEPDREQRPKWEIELAGALDNYGLWEVEPSVTYRLSRHTGLTLGLWMAGSPEGISFGGTTADRHWRWQTYTMDDYTRFFALRPSFRWRSPTWWLGRDKDFGLGLVLSPGATLPLPANHTLQINYFPNQEGVWTAIRSERVKNRGARWLFAHAHIAVTAQISENLLLSAGYTCSNFDPYESIRYITVEGRQPAMKHHRLMHSWSLALGICF